MWRRNKTTSELECNAAVSGGIEALYSPFSTSSVIDSSFTTYDRVTDCGEPGVRCFNTCSSSVLTRARKIEAQHTRLVPRSDFDVEIYPPCL